MEAVVLVIHLILAIAIICLILLQRSEGGALGMGGGSGGLASAHSTKTTLTRVTAICAGCFFVTSLVLGILAGSHHKSGSILDQVTAPATQEKTEDVAPAIVPAESADKEKSEIAKDIAGKKEENAATVPAPVNVPAVPVSE